MKRYLPISLAAILVAGLFAALPAAAQEAEPPAAPEGPATTYFLHRAACGGGEDQGLALSTEDLQEEGGDDCGNLLGGAPNELGLVSYTYPAIDALPLTLDVLRPVTGEITFHSNGGGIGQAEVDLTLTSTVGEESVVIAEQTLSYLMTPDNDTYTSPIEMVPDEALAGKVFDAIEFTTAVRGPSLLHGYTSVDDPASFLNLPTTGSPAVDTPPEDEPKKLTKADCRKIKNKKKRRRCMKKVQAQNQNNEEEPPAADVCPAYEPGVQGAEAETVIVTDEHTEEAPLEIPIAAAPGIGVGGDPITETFIGHAFMNVQMDSANADAGLYVRLEMPYPSDYDLYVNNPDGSTAARAAGFNPEPAVFNDTDAGGHTEPEAEQIDGVKTADCQGYTVDVATATGEGGELTLKYWIGAANYDPGAEGGGARAALELMQRTL